MLMINDKDKALVNSYIHQFGDCEVRVPVEKFLEPWSKSKKKLYKLLGNQMTHTFSLDESISRAYAKTEVSELIRWDNYFNQLSYCVSDLRVLTEEANYLYEITDDEWLDNKFAHDYTFAFEGKKFKFGKGERIIKALTKMTNYIVEKYPDTTKLYRITPDRHDKFISNLSMRMQLAKTNVKITLSIHPMDFLTMSDNEENWRSCMSLKAHGCYRLGTIEMMNSPCVLIAYIESGNMKMRYFSQDRWNSKRWRSLFIVDRRVILSGKNYPNSDRNSTQAVINEIVRLAEKNLGWNDFKEMENYSYCENPELVPITHCMYNDYKSNNTMRFYMRRSDKFFKTKGRKHINYSGKVYCLHCGRKINANTIQEYSDYVCHECAHHNDRAIKSAKNCPICYGRVWTSNPRRYMDSDTNFENPIHDYCFERHVHYSLTGEQFNDSDGGVKIVSDNFFDVTLTLTKEETEKFVTLKEANTFFDRRKLYDGAIVYIYNGNITSIETLRAYLKKLILSETLG